VRAVYVLVAILSFATPQVSWGAIEQSLSSSGAVVLAAPGSNAQISRAVTRTDKTFSTAFAIPTAITLLPRHSCEITYFAAAPADPPNLSLDSPPLAPRPPPA
jgi:hypothetical protein